MDGTRNRRRLLQLLPQNPSSSAQVGEAETDVASRAVAINVRSCPQASDGILPPAFAERGSGHD